MFSTVFWALTATAGVVDASDYSSPFQAASRRVVSKDLLWGRLSDDGFESGVQTMGWKFVEPIPREKECFERFLACPPLTWLMAEPESLIWTFL